MKLLVEKYGDINAELIRLGKIADNMYTSEDELSLSSLHISSPDKTAPKPETSSSSDSLPNSIQPTGSSNPLVEQLLKENNDLRYEMLTVLKQLSTPQPKALESTMVTPNATSNITKVDAESIFTMPSDTSKLPGKTVPTTFSNTRLEFEADFHSV
ncbi:hypothetical protein GEMRC1_012427 [Eukaryota sp. GEM-RC1]